MAPMARSEVVPTVEVETLKAQPYHSVIQTFGVVEALEEVGIASEIAVVSA